MYQVSLYYPGILRHFKLFQIDDASGINIKRIINLICEELLQNNISVVGVTTGNGPKLVKFFLEIENDVFENNYDFPILRFSCAAHTCQLLIDDLEKNCETFN